MKITLQFFWVGFLLLNSAAFLNGQEKKTRTIEDRKNRRNNDPIEVVGREVQNVSFTNVDGKISRGVGDQNWLRDLTLSIKNISKKNILRFTIVVSIPKQAEMPVGAAIQFLFPQAIRLFDKDGKPTGKWAPPAMMVLHPGETVKITPWGADILDVIRSQGATDIESVSLLINDVVFDDGTGWLQGLQTRADPNNRKNQLIVYPGTPLR